MPNTRERIESKHLWSIYIACKLSEETETYTKKLIQSFQVLMSVVNELKTSWGSSIY